MSSRAWGAAGPLLATGCGLIFAAGLVAGVILSPWVVPTRARDSGAVSDRPAAFPGELEGAAPDSAPAEPPRPEDTVPCDCGRNEEPGLDREDLAPAPIEDRAEASPDAAGEDVVPAPPPPEREVEQAVGESEAVDPLVSLIARGLSVPVLGVRREELRDSFAELRGAARRHEAIDILAPRNTPVVAVEDGTIAKLFTSHGGGGLTIYQFDDNGRFAYYYAHLERYAGGLAEGARVRRGQVIGFVGTSGNAPPDTPHLHFAVYRLNEDRRWWEGDPLNPYEILRPVEEPPTRQRSP
jgi:hypothetical protein